MYETDGGFVTENGSWNTEDVAHLLFAVDQQQDPGILDRK